MRTSTAAWKSAAWGFAALAATLAVGCDQPDERVLPGVSPGDLGALPVVRRDFGAELPDAGHDADPPADATLALEAIVPSRIVGEVGGFVLLDGSASTGAVGYKWDFGNGEGWDAPRDQPNATMVYDEPGRYQAVLTVFGADGDEDTASVSVAVVEPVVFRPRQSSTVATADEKYRAVVASPDTNELVVVTRGRDEWKVEERLLVDRGARSVAMTSEWYVVACDRDGTVLFLSTSGSGLSQRVFLDNAASRPAGLIATDDAVFVTLQATGEVARIAFDNGVPKVTSTIEVIEDPRGIAMLPDGRLLVSRWRSGPDVGEVAVVSADLSSVERWTLQVDPREPDDTEIGGLPSYLGAPAVAPSGTEVAIPSLQANVGQGEFLNGKPLTHEHMVRAITSFIDPSTGLESFDDRKQWDNRGLANAATYSSFGDFLWVSMRGNRAVERYDVLGRSESGTVLDIGYTIEGIALTHDDRFLLADARDSGQLVIYDVRELGPRPEPVATIELHTEGSVDAQILRGRQLFNDAQDTRLTAHGYIACAHCHLDGESDRRTWDFTDRGEGLRNTTSLLGRAGTGHGPLHWTANFDEVHDFENTIREHFAGTGLMDEADFETGTRSDPLGDPKAGVSDDLDALAAYVTSLDRPLASPYFTDPPPGVAEGEVLFEQLACGTCHGPPDLTDSDDGTAQMPVLHDVGTITPASGSRIGGPLLGIDTPTLRGVWNSPPYLHDGSVATLAGLFGPAAALGHGGTGTLTTDEVVQLVAYLLTLDYH